MFFFFSSRRRHTRSKRDWSSDVCSSDLLGDALAPSSSLPAREVERLRSYVRGRVARRPVELPASVAAETPVAMGEEVVGAIIAIADPEAGADAHLHEILDVTALAVLTELAASSARE